MDLVWETPPIGAWRGVGVVWGAGGRLGLASWVGARRRAQVLHHWRACLPRRPGRWFCRGVEGLVVPVCALDVPHRSCSCTPVNANAVRPSRRGADGGCLDRRLKRRRACGSQRGQPPRRPDGRGRRRPCAVVVRGRNATALVIHTQTESRRRAATVRPRRGFEPAARRWVGSVWRRAEPQRRAVWSSLAEPQRQINRRSLPV